MVTREPHTVCIRLATFVAPILALCTCRHSYAEAPSPQANMNYKLVFRFRWADDRHALISPPRRHPFQVLRSEDIRLLEFSPNGRWLVSADWLGRAILWDCENPSNARISFCSEPVRAVLFDADGHRLYAGSDTGNVHVYALPAMEKVTTIDMCDAGLFTLLLSPDGTRLGCIASSGDICFRSTDDWTVIGGLVGARCVGLPTWCSFSSDGRHVAVHGYDKTPDGTWRLAVLDARDGDIQQIWNVGGYKADLGFITNNWLLVRDITKEVAFIFDLSTHATIGKVEMRQGVGLIVRHPREPLIMVWYANPAYVEIRRIPTLELVYKSGKVAPWGVPIFAVTPDWRLAAVGFEGHLAVYDVSLVSEQGAEE